MKSFFLFFFLYIYPWWRFGLGYFLESVRACHCWRLGLKFVPFSWWALNHITVLPKKDHLPGIWKTLESKERYFFCLCVWVYGKHYFLGFLPLFYEHLNWEKANIFRFHADRWIGLVAQTNSNLTEGVPFHLRIPQKWHCQRIISKTMVNWIGDDFSATLMARSTGILVRIKMWNETNKSSATRVLSLLKFSNSQELSTVSYVPPTTGYKIFAR